MKTEFPRRFAIRKVSRLAEGLSDVEGFAETELPKIDELTEGGFLRK